MIVRIRPFLNVNKIANALAIAKETGADVIKNFESAFASCIGSPHAIAVDRGRSALLLALKILDLKEGDEVIVQSYIFHVVVDAILEVGAKPVLVDSSPDDFNIAAQAIGRALTPRTKAIIVTHLGLPCDIEEIIDMAGAHNCFVIENCAHTLGAQYRGKNVGTFGDISFFSFDVDKPISTGDGGMLVINNNSLLEKAQHIINCYKKVPFEKEREIIYGLLLHHFATGEGMYPEKGFLPVDFGKRAVSDDGRLFSLVEKAVEAGVDKGFYEHVAPYLRRRNIMGEKKSWLKRITSRVNGRVHVALGSVALPKIDSRELLMNSPRSAVGIECLKDFNAAKEARDRNMQYYSDHLDASAFKQPRIDTVKKTSFIRYTVLNNTKYDNSLITDMARENGFEIGIFNWRTPIHLCYPYNKLLNFDRKGLSVSEHLGRKLLSLPVHPYVDEESAGKIVHFLNDLAHSSR